MSNPSNNRWDISVWTNVVDPPTDTIIPRAKLLAWLKTWKRNDTESLLNLRNTPYFAPTSMTDHWRELSGGSDCLFLRMGDTSHRRPIVGKRAFQHFQTFWQAILLEFTATFKCNLHLTVYSICRILLQHDLSVLSQEVICSQNTGLSNQWLQFTMKSSLYCIIKWQQCVCRLLEYNKTSSGYYE